VHRAAQTFVGVEPEAAPGEICRLAFDEGRVRREHIGRVVDQDLDFKLIGSLDSRHAMASQRQIIVLLHRRRNRKTRPRRQHYLSHLRGGSANSDAQHRQMLPFVVK